MTDKLSESDTSDVDLDAARFRESLIETEADYAAGSS